jgi:hypothetical protein
LRARFTNCRRKKRDNHPPEHHGLPRARAQTKRLSVAAFFSLR